MIEYDKPMDIERRSFEIITQLLGEQVIPAENELVVKRVIHTTADFDYAENLAFSDHAVAQGIAALRAGCDIVTDTQMARSGINKRVLELHMLFHYSIAFPFRQALFMKERPRKT